MVQLSQKQINFVIKCIVFTSSGDCCMEDGTISISDVKELLEQFKIDAPDQMSAEHLDIESIYIFGEKEYQEDSNMNEMLAQTLPNLKFKIN